MAPKAIGRKTMSAALRSEALRAAARRDPYGQAALPPCNMAPSILTPNTQPPIRFSVFPGPLDFLSGKRKTAPPSALLASLRASLPCSSACPPARAVGRRSFCRRVHATGRRWGADVGGWVSGEAAAARGRPPGSCPGLTDFGPSGPYGHGPVIVERVGKEHCGPLQPGPCA